MGTGRQDRRGLDGLCGVGGMPVALARARCQRKVARGVAGSSGSDPCPPPPGPPVRLQVLDLEDNAIACWAEVLRLQALPRLAKLHLTANPIPDITYPAPPAPAAAKGAAAPPPAEATPAAASPAAPCAAAATAAAAAPDAGPVPFACLAALFAGECRISSWASVDELGRFPALRELRLTDNPLMADAKTGARFEVRLGGQCW